MADTLDKNRSRDVVRKLRLMASGHWVGLGFEFFQKVAADAAEEILRLRTELAEQDDFILNFTDNNRNGDWACAQCKPHSDMIKDGFVCGYHRAEARLAPIQLAQ